MKLVDANVLLYAINGDAPQHVASRRWLTTALQGEDRVGFAWTVLLAFLRVSTSARIFRAPLTISEAVEQLEQWTSADTAIVIEPRAGHLAAVGRTLAAVGTAGNLVVDAHLAVLAIQHRADVVSYDSDFSRFPDVRWHRPDDLLGD